MLPKPKKDELVQTAINIRKHAYAPYSNYFVGAALLTSTGKVYTGVNVENAVYSATVCAERVAILKAVSEGEFKFQAIAVATENGGSPCGSCRQVLAEFGLDTIVLIADSQGNLVEETTVGSLLPIAFTPKNLE
jgi:cytidine deaminase